GIRGGDSAQAQSHRRLGRTQATRKRPAQKGRRRWQQFLSGWVGGDRHRPSKTRPRTITRNCSLISYSAGKAPQFPRATFVSTGRQPFETEKTQSARPKFWPHKDGSSPSRNENGRSFENPSPHP